MPEIGRANIEVAHKLNEDRKHGTHHSARSLEILEIIEAIVLALVAVTTAWSGYQAALWDGRQDEVYEQSTQLRVQAQGLQASSGQERMYDSSTVVEWMKAEAGGQHKLAELFERRFRPEFRVAFEAWKKTDPLNNPSAPAGPLMMPEYHNAKSEQAAKLEAKAADFFQQGTKDRAISDAYVRATVLLATVLLLTAISQRFRTEAVRIGLAILAALLVCIPLWRIITLPRI